MAKNPQAFPLPEKLGGRVAKKTDKVDWTQEAGMTLLDYFAGQALMGILVNPTVKCEDPSKAGEAIAHACYIAAGFMLKEREEIGL